MDISGENNDQQVGLGPVESSQGVVKALDASSVHPEASSTRNISHTREAHAVQDLTQNVLHFFATASNEALGAAFLGLGLSTYFILGRLGLLLIGTVAGIALHAAWEERNSSREEGISNEVDTRRRQGKSLDILKRILDLREIRRRDDPEDICPPTKPGLHVGSNAFDDFAPETSHALTKFSDAIIHDYVKWWYSPILPGEASFPKACQKVLNGFFRTFSNHVSHKRPADVFLEFLTNASSVVIVFLNELSGALAVSRELQPEDAINAYLEQNPGASLANVLDETQQKIKLQSISGDILRMFLEPNALSCEPVKTFLQEILASLILEMTVSKCSRPDFINEWIIYILEEADPTELAQGIDVSIAELTNDTAVKSALNGANEQNSQDQVPLLAESRPRSEHRRTVSRAEEAMQEAMQEAKRLSDLIAKQDSEAKAAKASDGQDQPSSTSSNASKTSLTGASQSDTSAAAETDLSSMPDVTPMSTVASTESATPTTFGQIMANQDTIDSPNIGRNAPVVVPALTLHNAKISIFDDSAPNEKGTIKSRPIIDYLLQLEPPTSHYPGWMIARKYADFEKLHEVLRRISVISGVADFAESHQILPSWKGKTKASLRHELEQYLQDALTYQRLAECEGMKRFLEKDQHLPKEASNGNKGAFPAAFETVGKGVFDVLSSAPKGAALGGKAIVGGVTGVLGGVGVLGQKKQIKKISSERSDHTNDANSRDMYINLAGDEKGSLDATVQISRNNSSHSERSLQGASLSNEQVNFISGLPHSPIMGQSPKPMSIENAVPQLRHQDMETYNSPAAKTMALPYDAAVKDETLRLPPPPSEIADDYGSRTIASRQSRDQKGSPTRAATNATSDPAPPANQLPQRRGVTVALTIEETSIAVELFFAMINELYSLSSAWTLRLTLLNTAKSFLLRPGNANLESIRQLLQTTAIDANTTDVGIATLVTKMRENALPTEEELKSWPPLPSEEEIALRRSKARKLLVEKGMPQALTSVMGQAASGEALGKVFDCLQIERVARGLIFALVLQATRALTQ